ncbi:hypothetical protein RFI_04336 [Reticulomyxa filosa]|uniref:Uncharacterized protein n=1 Tax=Reticulomyxa filosa TaxID=46433 RepID=X6P2J6_RETFI|nr:hypothetical protein RFI_04336 [Reticulomyxa filosa]|eukprot:ETO32780.1 hypothetical protein RFI_04336 [Reticulomyxa filosa]
MDGSYATDTLTNSISTTAGDGHGGDNGTTYTAHESSSGTSAPNGSSGGGNECMYLQCDDMEGTPLLIGETQFSGACRYLADCKIQLTTGQGLSKDKNWIVISKHSSKFMLQKKADTEGLLTIKNNNNIDN